jgi:hypothetical protein
VYERLGLGFAELGAQFALLLGGGDQGLEHAFSSAQSAHPGRISCVIGHDETLAHLIQAGAVRNAVGIRWRDLRSMRLSFQAARSIGRPMRFAASVCQPSTFRMLI